MLIPESVCAELTTETANRLQDGRPFVAYNGMDESAQTYLIRGFQEVAPEDIPVVGTLKPKKISLARSVLFFVRDPSTDVLHSIPWITAPDAPKYDYHFALTTEFHTAAKARCPSLDPTAYFESQPEAVTGVVARADRKADTMFGISCDMLPDEHIAAVERSQQILADAGTLLHVQIGRTLLRAKSDTPDDPSAPSGIVDAFQKLFSSRLY